MLAYASLVDRVTPEKMVCLVFKDAPETKDHPDLQVSLDQQVFPVFRESRDHLDHQDQVESVETE